MDDTKWSETLVCPKCGSDDTDIGWTSGDGTRVTEKISTGIPIDFPHDKETVSTILRRPVHCLDCGATYEETWILKRVVLDEEEVEASAP
ncbi:MAG TPA: hypothetical protein VMU60_13640 [Syntrophobacteria bacterium]|nr:hypothetical protein [Syntrophobacteria bacterium]